MNKTIKLRSVAVIVILFTITLLSLIPFFWMISTSLKDSQALVAIRILYESINRTTILTFNT